MDTKKIIFQNVSLLLEEALRRELVTSKADFCRRIGLQKQNWRQVADGRQSFTHAQILAAAQLVGVDVNFIFGVHNTGNKLPLKTRAKALRH